MEYMINNTVKYNSSDGTLFCPDSSIDMITLTHLTSELLLLLMKNNGTPLSRDAILNELWEKRGLSASSNNLNNYISMLRKALAQCGYPDLITTIPKHGFLFQAEISVVGDNKRQQKVVQQSKSRIENIPLELTGDTIKLDKSFSSLFSNKIKVIIISISILFLLLPSLYNYFRLESARTELFSIDKCRVYLTDDTTRGMDRDLINSTIKMIVSNVKLKCENEANIYYFADEKVDSLGDHIMNDLLSYCPFESKAPCENYYLSKHENGGEDEN